MVAGQGVVLCWSLAMQSRLGGKGYVVPDFVEEIVGIQSSFAHVNGLHS